LDEEFREKFPRETWVNEGVLKFENVRSFRTEQDEVVIQNNGRPAVKWLKVRAQDVLVILDIKPGEVRRIAVGGQRDSPTISISAIGAREDGSRLKATGQDFLPGARAGLTSSNRFLVAITDKAVSIEVFLPDGHKAAP
jgi:hypothetical protein